MLLQNRLSDNRLACGNCLGNQVVQLRKLHLPYRWRSRRYRSKTEVVILREDCLSSHRRPGNESRRCEVVILRERC